MNYLDLAILIIFGLFILHSYYKGFLISVFGVASFFISWLMATFFSPMAAAKIFSYENLTNMMLYYTEGSEKIQNIEFARLNVAGLSADQLDQIIASSDLNPPLDDLIRANISGQAFKSIGLVDVGSYFNQTIVNFTVNVVSFIIVFMIVRLLLALVIGCLDYLRIIPRLKHFDSLMGMGLGVVNSFFAVFVLFMLVPILLTVLPFPNVSDYINSSFSGTFFYNSNFLLSLIKGGMP